MLKYFRESLGHQDNESRLYKTFTQSIIVDRFSDEAQGTGKQKSQFLLK